MKRSTIFILLIFGVSYGLHSQGITEAVRYSQTDFTGTARVLGTGGSFGAMGGDYSSLFINPAGLADYNKGEFIFTPSIDNFSNDAYLVKEKSPLSTQDSKFRIDNIAFVSAKQPIASSWLTSNFSIGFHNVASFSRSFEYQGTTEGSIVHRFQELGNTKSPDDLDFFEAGLAYETGAIYDFDENMFYESDFDDAGAGSAKSHQVSQSGSINELSLGWAGNYKNVLNVGVGVSIPFVSFEEERFYREEDTDDSVPFFESLRFNEFVETSGTGFNFKLGTVFKPHKRLRIGASIHSPTWLYLTDDYNNTMNYTYDDGGIQSNDSNSPDGNFKYKLTTPWRMIGSVGTILNIGGLKGFVNVDAEWIDYRNTTFDLSAYSDNIADREFSSELNTEVDNELDKAVIVRIGSEFVIADYYRVRGGYTINPTPFFDDVTNNTFSLGFGYRGEGFFFDLGVRFRDASEGFIPYRLLEEENEQLVNIDSNNTKVAMTFGFKF